MQAFRGVRDADVRGVWSPNKKNAASAAELARTLDVGDAKAYASITDMVADPAIDAIWLCGPNQARIENVEEIVHAIERGQGHAERHRLREAARAQRRRGEACHRAREARRASRTATSRTSCFAPQVELGRDAALGTRRRAHRPAVPRPRRRGAQRSAHAVVLAGRAAGRRRAQRHDVPLGARRAAPAHQAGRAVRHREAGAHHRPHRESQVVAPGVREAALEDDGQGRRLREVAVRGLRQRDDRVRDRRRHTVLGEATTSWSFVGAGLRLSAELLGPEYSMSWNTLDCGLKLFFSREVKGRQGEDLVEKQNAETGLMPVVANEAAAYGYEAEDRHFVRVFLGKEKPMLTFDDGVEVVKMLMTRVQSAEQGKTLSFPPKGSTSSCRPLRAATGSRRAYRGEFFCHGLHGTHGVTRKLLCFFKEGLWRSMCHFCCFRGNPFIP